VGDKIKAALYARVSTDDKDQDPELQLSAMRKYCEDEGLEVHSEYVDYKRARDYSNRTEWKRLLNDMKQRKFKAVLVYKIDRLSREAIYTLNILREFRERNIKFVSVMQDVDTSTTMGKFFMNMMAVWAETESDLIGENVRAGIARRIAKGKGWGRKPLNISKEKIESILEKHGGNKSAAARELKCSRAYINKILNG
jgi:DNA invertase Pin-like site-specific DNA recombinase